MTTTKITAIIAALGLGLGVAAGCNDRENVDSGNQGQKEPIGGGSTQRESPGLTAGGTTETPTP